MTKRRRILFVDDEIFNNSFYVRALEASGYDVTTAQTIAEAKKKLNEGHYDLAMLDLMFPAGEGEDLVYAQGGFVAGEVLATWMKKEHPEVKFVGFSAAYTAADWFGAHGSGFIHKAEISASELPGYVATVLGDAGPYRNIRSFIVHGHDSNAKLELKNYLQSVLGLPEPIVLHEQPSQGKTVMEKFEEFAQNVDVAFVLLTPDDKLSEPSQSDTEKRRARQNVIFEMGYFLGKFGRRRGRVILLHKGGLELPSDISGIIYIDISNGIEASGELIRRELSHVHQRGA